MAGVAQNVVVSNESSVFDPEVSSSDSFSITLNTTDETSLQELIDTELALRISNTNLTNTALTNSDSTIDKNTDSIIDTNNTLSNNSAVDLNGLEFNQQFLINEREHTSLHFVNGKSNINNINEKIAANQKILETNDLQIHNANTQTLSNENFDLNLIKDSSTLLNCSNLNLNGSVVNLINIKDSELTVNNKPLAKSTDNANIIQLNNPELGVGDSMAVVVSELTSVTTNTITVTETISEYGITNVVDCNYIETNQDLANKEGGFGDNFKSPEVKQENIKLKDTLSQVDTEASLEVHPIEKFEDKIKRPEQAFETVVGIGETDIVVTNDGIKECIQEPVTKQLSVDVDEDKSPETVSTTLTCDEIVCEKNSETAIDVTEYIETVVDNQNIEQLKPEFVPETTQNKNDEKVLIEKFIEKEQEIKNPLFKDTITVEHDKEFDTWTTVAEATQEVDSKEKPSSENSIIDSNDSKLITADNKTETSPEIAFNGNDDHKDNEAEFKNGENDASRRSPTFKSLRSSWEDKINGFIEDNTDATSCVITEKHVVVLPASDKTTNNFDSNNETLETTTEKKTVKKKKNSEGVDSTTTKTKKTKKTKKSDEKENHISVMTNGHNVDTMLKIPQLIAAHAEEDDLSNVCVRDLKQTYCSEAAKISKPVSKPSEEPVAPSVPIRELRRSFGDLHKACENAELTTVSEPTNINSPHMKSSFSKFDQLQKKTLLHVRSSDSTKAAKHFSQGSTESLAAGVNPSCKSCGKTVFAMEQIKAERAVWHKNCFRCKECNKQLTLDTYSSHEGVLYCKPHFKELFKPKVVLENDAEPVRRRKPEMIIRENQPLELPPDVVRASDKPDLGLDELNSLNVKSRFQVFEKGSEEDNIDRSPSAVNVKRSPSILSKLAKFQKKGMDVGVTDESLNGIDYEESSSSSEDEDEDGVVRSSKLTERPTSFGKMEDVKRTWESGQTAKKEERREERKQEIQSIRSRLFMGKQGKMKEMYEQAVAESEGRGGGGTAKKEMEALRSDKAKLVRERFERGEVVPSDSEEEGGEKNTNKEQEDMSVFEAGISKKSRSLFLEMDANVAKTQTGPLSPVAQSTNHHESPRKRKDTDSPEREIYRDPTIVRSDDVVEDDSLVKRSKTTSKMLSIFRQMEEAKEEFPDGPKPLKRFTPPPDYKEKESGSEEDEEEGESEDEEESEEGSDEDSGIVRASDKIEDEFLKQAQNAARAKSLKEKFEHWEPEKQSKNNAINMLDSDQASLDSTKSLRARFESLKSEQPKEKARPKVNRFVLQPPNDPMSICAACDKKVYLLEKVETNGRVFHKACFRCTQCGCILRMETYTLNNGHLYCLPHFKQLFIVKGNYDEGFGIDQHKRKWEASSPGNRTPVNGAH